MGFGHGLGPSLPLPPITKRRAGDCTALAKDEGVLVVGYAVWLFKPIMHQEAEVATL